MSIQQEYSGGQNNPDPLPQSNVQSVEWTDVYNLNFDSGDTCTVPSISALGELRQVFSVSTKNIYYRLGAAYNQRIGLLLYISTSYLAGLAPRSFTCTLSKVVATSLTGTIYCKIYDYSNAMVQQIDTIDVATLTNLDVQYTFEDLTATTALRHKSKLVIEFSGGDASNYVNINVNDTDAFDGENTVLYRMTSDSNGAVESCNPGQDLAGSLSI